MSDVPFATLADVLAADDTGDVGTLVRLEEATDLIRTATGQYLTFVADDVVTLQSSGRQVLCLPQIPVTDVADVSIDGTALDSSMFWWTPEGYLRHRGFGWPCGEVVVTYSHGFEEMPGALVRLCARLALESTSGGDASAETIQGYSVTYTTSPDQVRGEAMRILEPYMPVLLP